MTRENVIAATADNLSLKTKIRLLQALMLGVFTLGVAMTTSDLAGYYKFPISAFSLTTMLFGAGGSVICEIFARKLD